MEYFKNSFEMRALCVPRLYIVLSQRFLASFRFLEFMYTYPDCIRFLENLSRLYPKCSLIQITTLCLLSVTVMDMTYCTPITNITLFLFNVVSTVHHLTICI